MSSALSITNCGARGNRLDRQHDSRRRARQRRREPRQPDPHPSSDSRSTPPVRARRGRVQDQGERARSQPLRRRPRVPRARRQRSGRECRAHRRRRIGRVRGPAHHRRPHRHRQRHDLERDDGGRHEHPRGDHSVAVDARTVRGRRGIPCSPASRRTGPRGSRRRRGRRRSSRWPPRRSTTSLSLQPTSSSTRRTAQDRSGRTGRSTCRRTSVRPTVREGALRSASPPCS